MRRSAAKSLTTCSDSLRCGFPTWLSRKPSDRSREILPVGLAIFFGGMVGEESSRRGRRGSALDAISLMDKSGGLTAFAAGGVIATPACFSLGPGGLGVAGEAGPEAILPLARGRDGRLGVAMSGSSAAASVIVNIAMPDAD